MSGFNLERIEFHPDDPRFLGKLSLSANRDVKLEAEGIDSRNNRVTVLIGSNATGKSSLLSGIAEHFLSYELGAIQKRESRLSGFRNLRYTIDGRKEELVSGDSRRPKSKQYVMPLAGGDVHLPSRIIAITTTPFDKFPLPSLKQSENSVYRYVGLRDRTGRASPSRFLFETLSNLISDKSGDRRQQRVASILEFLGYEPAIRVSYGLRATKAVTDFVFQGPGWLNRAAQEPSPRDYSTGYEINRVARIALRNDISEDRLTEGLKRLTRDGSKAFDVWLNMRDPSSDFEFSRQLNDLRRVGLVSLRKMNLCRSDGSSIDISSASSGELSIVSLFLGLGSVLEDNSLVLMDEPEISLHPEWQSRFIELMLRTFTDFEGVHYIVATHSPLLVADIPASSTVLSLDTKEPIDGSDVSGQSSDFVLATAFSSPGEGNLFVRDEIIRALRLAADGQANSSEFTETIDELRKLDPHMHRTDPLRILISDLSELADRVSRQ